METIEFYNGHTMPKVGIGTFRVENNDECKEAVKHAIVSGYRSIDTAKVYGNEEQVGLGITTKIYSLHQNYILKILGVKMLQMLMKQVSIN